MSRIISSAMLKRGIFICIILLAALELGAQQISNKVLVAAGSVVSAGGYSVSQTVGEPMVTLIGNDAYILTQGFQQPSIASVDPEKPQGSGVKVYPNPVRETLVLELFGEHGMEFHVSVFGFNGAIYFKKDYSFTGKFFRVEPLDVSSYQRGTYFVRVYTEDRSISRLFKIEKM